MELTFSFKDNLKDYVKYWLHSHADSDAEISNWPFLWILSFSYDKEGVCCRDENIV